MREQGEKVWNKVSKKNEGEKIVLEEGKYPEQYHNQCKNNEEVQINGNFNNNNNDAYINSNYSQHLISPQQQNVNNQNSIYNGNHTPGMEFINESHNKPP